MLQLVRTKKKPDGSEEEYGEFLHLPGKRFYDFSDIRREIQASSPAPWELSRCSSGGDDVGGFFFDQGWGCQRGGC